MVEHYLHTVEGAERNAPVIDVVSCVSSPRANILSNKVSNTRRFRRVERGIQRHVRSGELWFVGRQGGKVIWKRLGTLDLRVARSTVVMLGGYSNGNMEISLVVDEKGQPLSGNPTATPATPDQPLPRVRQVLVPANPPVPQVKSVPAARPALSSPVPTLEQLLVRCRGSKSGLKAGTELKLDTHLKMLRRYVETNRPVADYKPQDIRDYLAKARADKDEEGRRRLKGQTINEAIWRLLHEAFALAQEEDFIPRNPMESVKREKIEPINRTQLKWADAERILEDVKTRGKDSYLELKFMLFMGVGQAEAKEFTGGAVDWEEKQITFVRQKTRKQYTVPLYPWAKDFIRTEMEPRLKQGKPVFDWRNPRKALETACVRLGFAKVDIRSLRRTLIIHLIQQKVDIRLIAKWQGHADAHLILSRYGAFIDAGYEKEALAKLGDFTGQNAPAAPSASSA